MIFFLFSTTSVSNIKYKHVHFVCVLIIYVYIVRMFVYMRIHYIIISNIIFIHWYHYIEYNIYIGISTSSNNRWILSNTTNITIKCSLICNKGHSIKKLKHLRVRKQFVNRIPIKFCIQVILVNIHWRMYVVYATTAYFWDVWIEVVPFRKSGHK